MGLKMPPDSAAIAARPPTTRSKVTNGSRLFLSADGRSSEARRLRDLVDDLAAPLGGMAKLDEAMAQRVRTCAVISVQLELMSAAVARGELIDATSLAALSSQQQRLLKSIAPPPVLKRERGFIELRGDEGAP